MLPEGKTYFYKINKKEDINFFDIENLDQCRWIGATFKYYNERYNVELGMKIYDSFSMYGHCGKIFFYDILKKSYELWNMNISEMTIIVDVRFTDDFT